MSEQTGKTKDAVLNAVLTEVLYRGLPTRGLWEFVNAGWPSDATPQEWADSWADAVADSEEEGR
jgi:hypothetical protein